jgi:hypothetical protein
MNPRVEVPTCGIVGSRYPMHSTFIHQFTGPICSVFVAVWEDRDGMPSLFLDQSEARDVCIAIADESYVPKRNGTLVLGNKRVTA